MIFISISGEGAQVKPILLYSPNWLMESRNIYTCVI